MLPNTINYGINMVSWNFEQSGVIPYRVVRGKIEVLLITSRKKKKWIIPKGLVENGFTQQESAAKEALEEAGIEGFVHDKDVGEYRFEKWGGICVVKVFLLSVEKIHDTWLEAYVRKRKWFTIREAAESVEREKLRELIMGVPEFLFKNQ